MLSEEYGQEDEEFIKNDKLENALGDKWKKRWENWNNSPDHC